MSEMWWVERVVAAKVEGTPKEFWYRTKYAGYNKFYWQPLQSFLDGNSTVAVDDFWEGQLTVGRNPYDVRQFLKGEYYVAPGHRLPPQKKRVVKGEPKRRGAARKRKAVRQGRRGSPSDQKGTKRAGRGYRGGRGPRKTRRAV